MRSSSDLRSPGRSVNSSCPAASRASIGRGSTSDCTTRRPRRANIPSRNSSTNGTRATSFTSKTWTHASIGACGFLSAPSFSSVGTSTRRVCSKCGANADPLAAAATRCGKCGGALVVRSDDNDKVVLERLRVYCESTKPVVDYYRSRPRFREVNGAQAPDLVACELESTIMDAARASMGLRLGAER